MGYGQLYHLAADPYEVNNLFNQPIAKTIQAQLMEYLMRWLFRSENTLTTGSMSYKV
jgi:hypothetical protein